MAVDMEDMVADVWVKGREIYKQFWEFNGGGFAYEEYTDGGIGVVDEEARRISLSRDEAIDLAHAILKWADRHE